MSKQKIELSKKRIISFVSPLFGLNSESKLFLIPFHVFYWGNSSFLDKKVKYLFAPFPTRRPCCEEITTWFS